MAAASSSPRQRRARWSTRSSTTRAWSRPMQSGSGAALIGGDWGGGNPNTSLTAHPRAKLENEKIANASTVTIDSGSVIDASATQNGTGGKVVVWSDVATSFAGLINARGGAEGGDGGFVEVSGKQ